MIDRDRLIELIDGACWSARGDFGHDDNGLEDYDTGEELDCHPQAVEVADVILSELENL